MSDNGNSMLLYKEVGYRIASLICQNGEKPIDVANVLGISIGHFYKLLRGEYAISDIYINIIAKRYSVDPIYILYGKDYIKDSQFVEFPDRFREDLKHIKELPVEDQTAHMIECMEAMCEILRERAE